jgi:transposase
MMARYELSETEWERIEPLMPPQRTGKKGRPPKDHKVMLNAMLWLARSGAEWQDLPERYGPWKSVYSRFCLWRDNGLLWRIFQALGADADYENIMIDSTSIRVHQHGTGGKKGLMLNEPSAEAAED